MNTQKALTMLAAVLLSISMWFFVISRGQSGVSIEVPVQFKDVPVGLTLSGKSDQSVTITLKGHDKVLRELRPEEVSLFMSVKDLKMGTNSVPLSKAEVQVPPTLRVASIKPRALTLFAEETIRKSVPVKVVISGLPLEGYTTRYIEVQPPVVNIEGVKSQVKDLKVVYTEPVEITGARSNVNETVKLSMDGKAISADTSLVNVRVVIVKERL